MPTFSDEVIIGTEVKDTPMEKKRKRWQLLFSEQKIVSLAVAGMNYAEQGKLKFRMNSYGKVLFDW